MEHSSDTSSKPSSKRAAKPRDSKSQAATSRSVDAPLVTEVVATKLKSAKLTADAPLKARVAPRQPVTGAATKPVVNKVPKPSAERPVQQPKSRSKRATRMVPAPEVLRQMIAEAAYFLAQQRQFVSGMELQDWLQAEQQIISQQTSKF